MCMGHVKVYIQPFLLPFSLFSGVWSQVSKLSVTMILWMFLSLGFISLAQCKDAGTESNKTSVLIAYKSVNISFQSNFMDKKKEFQVSLLKGLNKARTVCVGSFNSSYLPFQSNKDLNCMVTPTESSVAFYLWDLNENHTDIYYFYREDMHPPPYTCSFDNGTIIHVKECAISRELSWLFPSILGVSVLYCIFMTAAFCYIWVSRVSGVPRKRDDLPHTRLSIV
ncbi:hypothetical protein FKM82_015806 [Ascaphus truei]